MQIYRLRNAFNDSDENQVIFTQVDKNLYKLDGNYKFIRVIREESGALLSFEPEGCFPIRLYDVVHRETDHTVLGCSYIFHVINKLIEDKKDYLVEIKVKKANLLDSNNLISSTDNARCQLSPASLTVGEEIVNLNLVSSLRRRAIGVVADEVFSTISPITGVYSFPVPTSEDRVLYENVLNAGLSAEPLNTISERITDYRVGFDENGETRVMSAAAQGSLNNRPAEFITIDPSYRPNFLNESSPDNAI